MRVLALVTVVTVLAASLFVGAGAATGSSQSAAPPLQADASPAPAGDIPDNQVFLTFHSKTAGYSIKYPEGWAQRGPARSLTFRDKNNIVRIVVRRGSAATLVSVKHEMVALGVKVTSAPQTVAVSGARAVKVVYTTRSAPNPVTGKRVTLTVDRYYLSRAGRSAVVDLGTPLGVDNVDAYRLMIQSFRWR